jgi:hypothetical protein
VNSYVFDRIEPWAEDDYLALGETLARVELVDGNLLVSAPPDVRHQVIRSQVLNAVHDASEAAGLCALSTINLRLMPCRIYNPDFVIMERIDLDLLVVDSPTIRLLRYDGGHYAEHAIGQAGQPLRMTEPIVADIDPGVLLD